ncbi:MAG: DUF4926 domain-containing protein [Deltaproteobacteria bacterium]|nr:DUF4926 domain-containing protein [Deltaproteobacteria bacterium]
MNKLNDYDVVRLNHAIVQHNLPEGAIGTIVMIYSEPLAYEVEFCDDEGGTIALLTLHEEEISRVN